MRIKFDSSICVYCKGRYPKKYCSRSYCPLYTKILAYTNVRKSIEKIKMKEGYNSFSGDIFVSRFNYPTIDIGLLSPIEREYKEKSIYFNPNFWVDNKFTIKDVITIRTSLVNTSFKTDVKDIRYYSERFHGYNEIQRKIAKLTDVMREIAMSKYPLDIEVKIDKKIRLSTLVTPTTPPIGPKTGLKKARVTENTSLEPIVEKVVYDNDLKTLDAIKLLIDKGKDNYDIIKLLSVGLLGVRIQRRLVPTRWAITAVDNIISNEKLKEIRSFERINYTKLFTGNFFGNYYVIVLFPISWSYELIESYMPASSWNFSKKLYWLNDYEGFNGRKDYADNTAGGYYATRLTVVDYLYKNKIQAAVLAIRLMSSEYAVPLGVFVVREATRKAIQNEIKVFYGSKKENMKHALKFIRFYLIKEFNFKKQFVDEIFNKSYIVNRIMKQTTLKEWY